MQTVAVIVRGWLVVNAVVLMALMMRRDRPGVRASLFDWVVRRRSHRSQRRSHPTGASTPVERTELPIR